MKHSLAVFIALPALILGGCYIEESHHSDPRYYEPIEPAETVPAEDANIDADARMEDINPGYESGLYVEYLSGGLWILFTTCGEVDEYGECEWDIQTTVRNGGFIGAEGYELDAGETVATDELGAWTVVYTGYDFDGLYVQTTPGAALEIDALLDGEPANAYMFWVDSGAVRLGAASNPLELIPDFP